MSTLTLRLHLTEAMKGLAQQVGKALLDEVAAAQVVILNQRLNEGRGLNDAAMPPLTPAYVRRSNRRDAVRSLLNTGHMRRSIRVVAEGNTRTIGFGDDFARDKAVWNHTRYPWWGVSARDMAYLQKVVDAFLQRLRGTR